MQELGGSIARQIAKLASGNIPYHAQGIYGGWPGDRNPVFCEFGLFFPSWVNSAKITNSAKFTKSESSTKSVIAPRELELLMAVQSVIKR